MLGARSLEGLNLRVELSTRALVDAGPAPAAAFAQANESAVQIYDDDAPMMQG